MSDNPNTVVTYGADGTVLSNYTDRLANVSVEQLAMNALDLAGAVEARVFDGDGTPIHARRATGVRGGEAIDIGGQA